MDIKLDDQQLSELVGKQILDSMSEEAKNKLISDAIVELNKAPASRGYGAEKPQSPLQQSFNIAVAAAVNRLVRELVEDAESPVRAAIVAAANDFIKIFPDTWADQRLQTEVMAAIVTFARENARTE